MTATTRELFTRYTTTNRTSFCKRLRLLTAAFALFLVVVSCGGDTTLAGIVREPAPDVSQVVLPDVADSGREFATTAAPGRLLLVYFGYTSCPDICPTTLADIRRSVADLGNEGENIDLAMITVDPQRDTPERLTAYAQTFFDEAHALRTNDPAQLAAAAEAYGASYEVAESDDGVIEVAHSAFLYVVDSNGHILVQWPFGTSSEDMASDLSHLMKNNGEA